MIARRLPTRLLCISTALLCACGSPTSQQPPADDPEVVVAYDAEAIAEGNIGLACDGDEALEERVAALVGQMSLAQKVNEMHGLQIAPVDDLYLAGGDESLGIPAFRMVDGPRGVKAGTATAFPVGMARGATWDPALEKRVGEAIGLEASARGANVILAPTINILRHPGWGRSQETYGEDSFHMGAMGVGFISGAQNHVISSVKHYALNSIEDTRFDVDVSVDERTLREVYLPHFRRAVHEAAVYSVMSAYNKVNGAYCAENPPLLRDILKDEWGFPGFVESDWLLGTRSTVESALAGLDIEMPQGLYYDDDLITAVDEGEVPAAVIDEAVTRILRAKFCFGLDAPSPADASVIESPEHLALAREVAARGIVLLENDGALPLDADALGTVAIVGGLADVANMGDHGSSDVTVSASVSPLQGLVDALGEEAVAAVLTDTPSAEELSTIAAADVAVVVVGLTWEEEGELIPMFEGGGDRDSLALPAAHVQLIHDVAAANPNAVVVLEGGGALLVREWVSEVSAVLMAWYPGAQGGHAIAEVLLGAHNPSGRLPLTVPRDPSHLPPFDHESLEVTYDYEHGYRFLDHNGHEPEYAFGYGLSYTTFEYEVMELSESSIDTDGALTASVRVTNTGERAGDEVVQLYVGYPDATVTRPLRELKAFGRLPLEPGETKDLELTVAARELAYYDETAGAWRVEPGRYTIDVGASSRDLRLAGEFTIE